MPCLTKSARSSKVMNVCVAVLYSRRSGYFLMITGFWAFAMKIHVCTSGAFFCSQFSVRLADTVRQECRDGSEEGLAAAHVARAASTVCPSRRVLRFRRGACRYASLADLYCAFGMTFLRDCYHQILRPRRHLPRFSNSLCRHAGAYISLNPHLGWQAAESYVERSDVFALIPGHRVLADCPVAAIPSSVMNSRLVTRSPRRRGRTGAAGR